MKDCRIPFGSPSRNDSVNHYLKSIRGIKKEYHSSSESLLTLLNTSIEHQQASFQSLDDSVNMSKHNSQKQVTGDAELELFVGKYLERQLKAENQSELEDIRKQKKKEHKDRDGTNSIKYNQKIPAYDKILHKENKERKHRHSSTSEVDDNGERRNKYDHKLDKIKKKKHTELGLVERERTKNFKESCREINKPSFDVDISHKKSKTSRTHMEDYREKKSNWEYDSYKKRKQKHSSVSKEEYNYGKNSISRNIFPKKPKKNEDNERNPNLGGECSKTLRRKHSDVIKVEANSNLKNESSEKKKNKHSSISETDDNHKNYSIFEIDSPKKRKKMRSSTTEVEDNSSKKNESSTKKKKKHSSISETDDNHEISSIFETNSLKKSKNKHSSTTEVEDNSSIIIKSSTKMKENQSSISKTDDSHENSSTFEINSPRKTKNEHSSTTKVENNSSMDIEPLTKKKKKHSSISETDDNQENSSILEIDSLKKSKKKQSSTTEVEDNSSIKSKSSTKMKENQSSISKTDDNHENSSIFEIDYPKKTTKEHSSTTKVENNSSMESESSTKKKKKHSSISETDDNHENSSILEIDSPKKTKKEHSSTTKVENNSSMEGESSTKKKKKHSSISETDDNHENSSILEIDSPKKTKKEHSSTTEVEDNSSMEIESPSKKKKTHSSSSKANEKHSSRSGTDDSFENYGISNEAQVETKKKCRKPKSNLNKSLSENVKNTHKKYYLTPKLKLENEDEEDPNKSKTMDLINEALDVALEKKQLNDEDVNILSDLQVLLPWDLPASHTIETRLSYPTSEQQKRFKKLDITMKSGHYSKAEDQTIMSNWEQFCKEHDLKISPLLFFPVEGETRSLLPPQQRLNFVRYLGKGLKHRTLSSIYSRFQLLFRPYKKGKFSPEEDNIILTFVENSSVSNKYSALSTILNRGRELIKKRHQVLVADDEKLKWDNARLQDLLTNLLEATGKENMDDLKEFAIQAGHWKVLEKKMGIPATKIKRKWMLYLYPRLFIEEYGTLNDIRLKLIDLLYQSQETDRKNINWVKMAQNFDGMSSVRLYKIFMDMLAMYVTEADKANFRDTVICLKGMVPHMLLQRTRHLKKYICHDNKLLNSKLLEPIVTF